MLSKELEDMSIDDLTGLVCENISEFTSGQWITLLGNQSCKRTLRSYVGELAAFAVRRYQKG